MEAEASKQAARTAIRKVAKTYNLDIVEIINATVVSVDKTARTCVVTPISGKSDTNIEDVGLMPERNDGEFKIPAVGSTVGVTMSTQVAPYIFSWSDLAEWYLVIGTTTIDVLAGTIKFGDGSFLGLVKVSDLTTKLNAIENDINTLKNVFATWAPVANDGGAALKVAAATWYGDTLTPTNQSEIENENITHGTT